MSEHIYIYVQTCESYVSCIFVRMIPLIPANRASLDPLSHVAGNKICENPDNFGI